MEYKNEKYVQEFIFDTTAMKVLKSFFAVAFILALVIALAGCDKKPDGEQKVEKIGILLPLTGPLAEYGERVKKGVDIAAEQINQGKTSGRVDFVVMDSQADPKTGLSAFGQMTQMNGVRYVVGDVSSSVTLAIVPMLEQQKVLMLSPAASSNNLSNSSPLFARAWPTNDLEASAVAKSALQGGCKRVATVIVNVDYGIGLGNTFHKIFQTGGGTVVLNENFPLGGKEYRTIWQKVNRAKPECVYFVGHKPEIIEGMNQYAEAGLKYKMYGNTNFEDTEILSTVGKTIEGVVFGTATLDMSSNEANVKSFISEFTKKYGGEPTLYSANGFDLVNLAVELQRKHGDNVAAAMSDLKQRSEIKGAAGAYRFMPSGDIQRPIALKIVKDSQYKTLGYY